MTNQTQGHIDAQLQAQDELLLERQKTIDELLEALKELHELGGQIKAYWTGTGQRIERLISKAEGRG